jgi:hypothetical protein
VLFFLSVLGTCLLISLAPNWREWRWGLFFFSSGTVSMQPNTSTLNASEYVSVGGHTQPVHHTATHTGSHHWWLEAPTSFGQSALFTFSALYFTLDLVSLYFRARISSSKVQRVALHHILSIFGLLSCVWTGQDGPLVLVGLLLAEASSPPLHLLSLCRHASRSRFKLLPSATHASGWLRCLMRPLFSLALSMDLSLLHVLAFLLTRLMLLQVVAHAVMPFALLMSTKVVATVLVLLSACQFLGQQGN